MNFIKWMCLFFFTLMSAQTNGQTANQDYFKGGNWSKAKVGEYATVDKEDSGFLLYKSKIDNCELFALSLDIGSASPDEDLRLYLKVASGVVVKVFTFPMVRHRYIVLEADGRLNIFLTDDLSFEKKPISIKPLMTIDPSQLIEVYKGYASFPKH